MALPHQTLAVALPFGFQVFYITPENRKRQSMATAAMGTTLALFS